MRAMDRVLLRASLVATAMAGIVAVSQAVILTTPYEVHFSWDENRPITLATGAAWVVALFVLMIRQPANHLWKVILAWTAAGSFLALSYLPIEPRPLIEVPRYIFGDLWAAVFIHLIVVYPAGRFARALDRQFVITAYVVAVGTRVLFLVVSPEDCWPICGNPIAWFRSEAAYGALQIASLALAAMLMAVSLRILVAHWRGAGPSGRRQISPMLVAAPIWLVTVFAGYFADAFLDEAARDFTHQANLLSWIQQLVIPLAILIGALRSSLARGNVADLALELGHGVPLGSLQRVLARTIRDPSLVLAFPAPAGNGYVDADGRPVAESPRGRTWSPITRADGEVLAILDHDPALLDEDAGMVEAVGSLARMALENERLAAQVRAQLEEVRASRERLAEAGDAERRRIERDLHDGAQQRLVALALRLQTARGDHPEAAALLDAATDELQAAVADVRGFARGLHPTILTDLGLAAAVDALAERSVIPIRVDIPATRFPDAVEATTYFVVAEAITNVTRYAGARSATVSTSVEGDRVVTTVSDDGRGGADPTRGSGLKGLADRVEAARGRLDVRSPQGGGTTVIVDLPIA